VGGRFLSSTDTTTTESFNTDLNPDLGTYTEEPNWLIAVRAAEDKKATEIRVLDLTGVTTFTDFFVICNGSNAKQMQAITDEIALRLKNRGERANSIEGYDQGEWILSDYSDLIVHVFSEKARAFYDLDRLWRQGKVVEVAAE
jgi:ribosome-associated protein